MINAKRLATIHGSDTRPHLVLLPGIVADLFASVGNVFMRLVLLPGAAKLALPVVCHNLSTF